MRGKRAWRPYESENFLQQERENAGFSITALAKEAGVQSFALRQLELGEIPVYYSRHFREHGAGTLRPWVLRVCEILGASVEQLFPREVCAIVRGELLSCQIQNILGARPYLSHRFRRELWAIVKSVPVKRRYYRAFLWHVWYGLSFSEIGRLMGVGPQRASQIVTRIMNRLSAPHRIKKLEALRDEITDWSHA